MLYQVKGQSGAMMRMMKITKLICCVTLLFGIIGSLWLGLADKTLNDRRTGETLQLANDRREHLSLSHKGAEANSKGEKGHSKNIGILVQHSWTPFSAKHDYIYLINNRLKCVDEGGKLYKKLSVIAIVASDPRNIDRRNVIRMTWIRHAIENKIAVKVMFIVGVTSDGSIRNKIKHEAFLYKDIIQESFQDTYLNLTVKTIGALKWATKLCPRAKFFMKLDDDVVVNIGNLTGFLESFAPSVNYLGGIVQAGSIPFRNPQDKWYTPEELYPKATYPPYLEGKIYIMSMDVAKKIYDHTQTLQIFPWEDVFIGICAKQLSIIPQNIVNFRGVWTVRSEGIGIIKTDETLANLNFLYVVYDLTIGEMIEIWQAWMSNSWD